MSLNTIPGIGGDGSVTATTTPQKIANSLSVQRVVTISSLKDVAGTVDGETVLCEGYYTKGDCEPLSYYWDDDSVLSDDGVDSTHPGLVVQPTSVSGAGRWVARRPDYVNVKWYGAKGDNVQNDQPYIQRACYEAIHRSNLWPQEVFIPGGTYAIGSGILLKKDSSGDKAPEAFSLLIRGEGGFPYNVGSFTRLRCTHNDTFAIGMQLGKGIRIRSLYITGQNTISFTSPYDAYTSPEADYVINSCRDNQYSPYSGIVIDPFGRTGTVIEANRYPGYSAEYTAGHTQGGSTDVKIEDCRIEAFVANICISPNGYTLNAEQIEIKRCRLEQSKVGLAICQLQSRSVRLEDVTSWNSTLYLINTVLYGQGAGQLPYITGGNLAGTCKYLLWSNATVSCSHMDNFFAESFFCIGRVSTDSMHFTGCMFKWTLPSTTEAIPQTVLHSDKQVSFTGCVLLHSANAPNTKPIQMQVARLRFYACTMDFPIVGADTFRARVAFDNCNIRHFNLAVDNQGDNYSTTDADVSDAYAGRNSKPIGIGQELRFQWGSPQFGRVVRHTATSNRMMHLEAANVAITFNDANQTATFTTAQAARWVVGLPVTLFLSKTNEFGGSSYPVGFVSNVSGSTVTITGFPIGISNGSYAVYAMAMNRWHEPCIGNTTNGSATVSSVRCESAVTSVWRVGEYISGSGIPVGTYVAARDNAAKTITLSQNATATATGVDLYDALVVTRAYHSAQPTTGGWTKGDLVDDTTGATNGWRCTASGTFGSGTDPTFATR